MNLENIIISHSTWHESDKAAIFNGEPVHISSAVELPALLVETGIYKSTSEARRAGRCGAVPAGYTELKASKKRFLYIWNPREQEI